jgi:predicted hydrocarbon binding protein
MKGAIFIAMNELVEEAYGLPLWLKVLDAASSDGAYTSAETYDDEALLAIAQALSEELDTPMNDLLFVFGNFLFGFLYRGHPDYVDRCSEFFEFIESVGSMIHKEVHKLDEDALPPTVSLQRKSNKEGVLSYRSSRQLCRLAEGLLTGASKHFSINISLEHLQCMHKGADHCLIKVTQLD